MSRRAAWGFLLLSFFSSSCLWRGYARVLSIHVDVLTGMVDKTAWKVEEGRQLSPNDVTELLYPLQRGRQFEQRFRAADAPPSLRLFAVLLRRYDQFARRVDRTRADAGAWRLARVPLLRRATKLRRIAALVRAQLRREDG
jgi:hypothetical protein